MALEGAPGVGKSTIAAALGRAGAAVVPEVNRLFGSPPDRSQAWYLDRQLDRVAIAARTAAAGEAAILDGDPLQPVWFGWIYPEEGWTMPEAALAFYVDQIAAGRPVLPDRYVLVTAPEHVRTDRMLARERARGLGEVRAQAKVARYARMVEPQGRYFAAIDAAFPGWVERVDARSDPAAIATALLSLPARSPPPPADALAFVGRWLTLVTRPAFP